MSFFLFVFYFILNFPFSRRLCVTSGGQTRQCVLVKGPQGVVDVVWMKQTGLLLHPPPLSPPPNRIRRWGSRNKIQESDVCFTQQSKLVLKTVLKTDLVQKKSVFFSQQRRCNRGKNTFKMKKYIK